MSTVFVVRQPVFDRGNTAVAYDLSFREATDGGDSFVRAYLDGTFDTFRDGLVAHIRVTRRQLAEGVFGAVDPDACTLLVPAEFAGHADALAALRALARAGFEIGVDDYAPTPAPTTEQAELFSIARLVRVDLRVRELDVLHLELQALRNRGKQLIAEHVLDGKAYRACTAAGFDLMQGGHFARPEPLPSAEIPTSTIAAIRVMALARDEDTTDRQLEEAISADPAITFQLLRIVNSAAVGAGGVTSIGGALRVAGRDNLVRWLALASYATRPGKTGVDDELVRRAVQRAHFCDAMARQSRTLEASTAFLVGIFSLLDAILRVPLAEVVARVNLAEDVRRALIDREGAYAMLIHVTECYELGMWESAAEAATQLGVADGMLAELHASSLRNAEIQVAARRAA